LVNDESSHVFCLFHTKQQALVILYFQNNIFKFHFAKENTGYPSICRPVQEGGLGFDYRLNMDIPRQWIKVCQTVSRI